MLQPDHLEWRLGLARCLYKEQKHEETAALLDALLQSHPDKAEFWLMQANAYIGMKQPVKAAENLEIVARLGKATPETMSLLGDIYVNEALFDLAAEAYGKGLELDSGQSVARPLRSVEALAQRGALPQAKELLARVKTQYAGRLADEDQKKLLKLEARIAVADGEGGAAVAVLQEIVALDPLDGDALMLLGQHYVRVNDADRAIFFFERAASLEAFEADAKVRHAQVLVGQSKFREALPLLRRAQEVKPREDVGRYLEQVERLARSQS
jgi:Flp pilus assembly protein TadD